MDTRLALRKMFPRVNGGAGPLPGLDYTLGWTPYVKNQPSAQVITAWMPGWLLQDGETYPTQPTPEQLAAALAPAPPPVPAVISPAQLREWLIRHGLLDAVNASLAAIADATERQIMQSWFEFATVIERSNAKVVALAGALGMTDAQVDDAFRAAATL